MDKDINKISDSFNAHRSPCRRMTIDRRRIFFLGGYKGFEKRIGKDRRKGVIDRRRSLA